MSERNLGKVLLVINFTLPILTMVVIHSLDKGLLEVLIVFSIVNAIILVPGIYILMNIQISRMMRLPAVKSTLIMLAGLLEYIVAGYAVWIAKYRTTASFIPDAQTINYDIFQFAYYITLAVIYFLIKKDDNTQPTGENK